MGKYRYLDKAFTTKTRKKYSPQEAVRASTFISSASDHFRLLWIITMMKIVNKGRHLNARPFRNKRRYYIYISNVVSS